MMLIKNKKALETFEVIVTAAIALAILVVSFALLTGRVGIFSKSISSCEQNGGICMPSDDCRGHPSNFQCSESNLVCCMDVGGLV